MGTPGTQNWTEGGMDYCAGSSHTPSTQGLFVQPLLERPVPPPSGPEGECICALCGTSFMLISASNFLWTESLMIFWNNLETSVGHKNRLLCVYCMQAVQKWAAYLHVT